MEKEHFEYLRKEAINEFNFENVYSYMKLVDWTWGLLDNDAYIPSVRMLKRTVYNMFQEIYDNNKTNISSGGFTVTLDEDGAGINFSAENSFIDAEYDT